MWDALINLWAWTGGVVAAVLAVEWIMTGEWR